jgi:hypothetical protein
VFSSSTVTDERHSRKLGGIGVRPEGTNRSACSRSIDAGSRPNENAT